MTDIEKFLDKEFTQVITEDKTGIKCLFRHKKSIIEDGVVYFEKAKKSWTKKPIMNKRQYVIVDANMTDVLEFLNKYFNISEKDYPTIRNYITNKSIEKVENFFKD
jgi:hypothetical protein